MTPFRVRYQTIEFDDLDIHLRTLKDNQQYYDPKGEAEKLGISSASWPIFGIVWPSSMVLAHFLNDYSTENKRILEVGCGIGLASLLLNQRDEDITATDIHPEVEGFLKKNSALNNNDDITFERTNWKNLDSRLGKFDLIIGSDLLYEDEHIELLANFINQHAKDDSEVILVDPGRGRKNKLSRRMENFGYRSNHTKPRHTDYLSAPFKGHIMRFSRAE